MRIGIDYTSAVRQRAGIGRYTREMVSALLALESPHHYTLFAATGGLSRESLQSAIRNLQSAIRNSPFSILHSPFSIRTLPLSDDWLARLWHRLRLPIPVELFTGPLDIFYSPDFVLPPVLRATRTMLTVHDLSFMRHPEAFVSPLRRYLGRVVPRSIERSDRVLADSAHTRSDLITLFGVPPEKVEVLYSGVDSRFSPQPETGERDHLRERYGIGARPYVLSVGTLQPRKNFVRLIRAFARLNDRLNQSAFDLQLVIAGGKGWLYEKIFAEAERHDSVRLIGFVDDADLPALYRNAALLAFPSLYEGFGLPVLEAMACGTPVVCSSKSSLPEVAGEAGLLVDPLDVDALSEAMARVLEDKTLREEMVARGYAQAAQFTWERAAHQLLRMMNGE